MIRKDLLKKVTPELQKAFEVLDFASGGLIKIHILNAAPNEDELEAILSQGGPISKVNDAREKVGLHKLSFKNNLKSCLPEWAESLSSGKGVQFVFLNHFNRMKTNQIIEDSILYVQEVCPGIGFDRITQNSKNDFFFMYMKEQAAEEIEDPSEEVLDLQDQESANEEKPKSKRTKKS
jgi:hypothetical protein